MAEAVFRHRICQTELDSMISVDSVGTHGYHIGGAPDPQLNKNRPATLVTI
jgi:protein-tyrosine phosphatase